MSRNKMIIVFTAVGAILLVVSVCKWRLHGAKTTHGQEVAIELGDIRITVTTTGIVEPQNRLQIKPSINGRIEEIVVNEGDNVCKSDVLAWMSSTERAALLDASGFQGEQARQYWEEVYKKTPIVSPIDGQVIVRSVEPGQTITTSDDILVLSDRLIVNAQFDETDIGRIAVGQKAFITLDAYPQDNIPGVVDHVAYESNIVNNVTIYDVDILPQSVPDFFRSGMSANVEVVEKAHTRVPVIPVEALHEENGDTFVIVKTKSRGAIVRRNVVIGLRDEKNAEVISGLSLSDIVVIKGEAFAGRSKDTGGSSPFMPSRPKR